MSSREPVRNVMAFQLYDINKYTFYMEAQDQTGTYQNSGAMIEAQSKCHGRKCRYCSMIKEIWDLDYTVTKISIFCVRWVPRKMSTPKIRTSLR